MNFGKKYQDFTFNCIVGHIFSFTNYSWLEISNLMMN